MDNRKRATLALPSPDTQLVSLAFRLIPSVLPRQSLIYHSRPRRSLLRILFITSPTPHLSPTVN